MIPILLAENQEEVLQELHDELEEKGVCHNVELSFQRSQGKVLMTSCSASILYDKRNEQTGVLYIAMQEHSPAAKRIVNYNTRTQPRCQMYCDLQYSHTAQLSDAL